MMINICNIRKEILDILLNMKYENNTYGTHEQVVLADMICEAKNDVLEDVISELEYYFNNCERG